MDALRLPAGRRGGDHALRRRAAPGGALPPPAPEARPAAARRADQPPRRRERGLARALPAGVPGHGGGRHPRPLLPRQRRRLDPRARPRRGHPLGGQLLLLARAEEAAPGASRRSRRRARQRTLERELEWVRMSPRARQAKTKARLAGLRGAARRGRARARGTGRDRHPARPAPGRRGGRGRAPAQGLRRPPPDRGPQLQPAARRHRRRHRPQRRRQDHAVPHDHRPGEARRRRAARRRDGRAWPTSTRAATRSTRPRTSWQEISGGAEQLAARQAPDRRARLRRLVQLQGLRPAEAGRATSRAASATASTWPSCSRAAATCCCSTSPPTTSTSTRCGRSKTRCSPSPAARW